MGTGLLIIVSGPSGAGKGTVLREVVKNCSDIKLSVSVTTRKPREGETEGVNYFFKSIGEYNALLEKGAFLEHQEVYGNYYGTPADYVNSLRGEGYDVVLEIDVKGAKAVKEKQPEAVMIFLTPGAHETLTARLLARRTESPADLKRRIAEAKAEMAQIEGAYDYIVINDLVEKCSGDILSIIRAEKLKVENNINFINTLL